VGKTHESEVPEAVQDVTNTMCLMQHCTRGVWETIGVQVHMNIIMMMVRNRS
jgi:hypothetical protein